MVWASEQALDDVGALHLLLARTEEEREQTAIRRDHPNPVTLESEIGGRVHVNWDHVLYVEEAPPR